MSTLLNSHEVKQQGSHRPSMCLTHSRHRKNSTFLSLPKLGRKLVGYGGKNMESKVPFL